MSPQAHSATPMKAIQPKIRHLLWTGNQYYAWW
jgi:hypothetical protein